jgi:hypothetical protein
LPVLALAAAGQSVDPVSLEIGAGEYGEDSGRGERGARIDRLDPRMRVWCHARSRVAHFHGPTAPTFVQRKALICALIPLSFPMPGAA